MLAVLIVTLPFFALVLCGFLAVRWGLLPLEAIPGLNVFVLFFALPCLLFRFGANTPIARLVDPTVFMVWLLCAMLMVALVGKRSAGPLIITIFIDLIITTSLCIALSRLDRVVVLQLRRSGGRSALRPAQRCVHY